MPEALKMVHLTPAQRRRKRFYHPLLDNARALVMPSLWPENCPLVALEALSMGTPVVASNIGGLPEIAGLQGEGLVCELDDLKETLIRVRAIPPNRKDIKDVYRQHFSPESFLRRYLELIERRQ